MNGAFAYSDIGKLAKKMTLNSMSFGEMILSQRKLQHERGKRVGAPSVPAGSGSEDTHTNTNTHCLSFSCTDTHASHHLKPD